jgi:hypothetical protein
MESARGPRPQRKKTAPSVVNDSSQTDRNRDSADHAEAQRPAPSTDGKTGSEYSESPKAMAFYVFGIPLILIVIGVVLMKIFDW